MSMAFNARHANVKKKQNPADTAAKKVANQHEGGMI